MRAVLTFATLALVACGPSAGSTVDCPSVGGTTSGTSTTSTTSSTTSTTSAWTCSLTTAPTVVCPPGAFGGPCANGNTLPCCNGGVALNACSMPAGILTHECWTTCASGLCAVVPSDIDPNIEKSTCCDPGSPTDPCMQPVAP